MTFTFTCNKQHYFDKRLLTVLMQYNLRQVENPSSLLDMTLCDSARNNLVICKPLSEVRFNTLHSTTSGEVLCMYIALEHSLITVLNNGISLFVLVQTNDIGTEQRFYPSLITLNN